MPRRLQEDREQLQSDDEVDDAVARAVTVVRLLEPTGQHTVFCDAIQDAVSADDRRIPRLRQNQHTNQDDEAVEEQLHAGGAPTRYIAMPPIKLAKKSGRTLSGMIITAKNETSEVKSRL